MNRKHSILERIQNMKEPVFLFFLFITSFIFRLPTLFNDFYDVDELAAIVQTKEFLAGFRPGVDFLESKLPLYHAIFKLSYLINAAYGWVIVHFITILFVFLTALTVYYIGKLVRDRKTGVIASLLYAVLISSFNRHFMATNGEVIYNLPVAAGLLFFLYAVRSRSINMRIFYSALVLVSTYAAVMVKLQAAILLIFIVFSIVIYIPYYRDTLRNYITLYASLIAVLLIAAGFDFFVTKKIVPGLVQVVYGLFFYATASRSSNPLVMLGTYGYRQLTLALWHAVLWVPAAVYMYRFIRNRFRSRTVEESLVALFALVTFLMVFAQGARLYYHYFMTSYPALSVTAAIALLSFETSMVKKISSRFIPVILIPGLFFLMWNFKDVCIKYFKPEYFYNEPRAAFIFRAVVVSSMDDYLLPNSVYRNAVEYIRKNTKPSDTIFVWGDGPHLYYFSDRRIAIHHVWPKGLAIRIEQLYGEHNPGALSEAEAIQNGFIAKMELKKPALFIDTAPKGLHRGITKFGDFAKYPYNVPPLMRRYLDKNYRLETVVDDYKIYRRVKH